MTLRQLAVRLQRDFADLPEIAAALGVSPAQACDLRKGRLQRGPAFDRMLAHYGVERVPGEDRLFRRSRVAA